MYKIRVTLDTKEDVIRTLLVNQEQSLEQLHFLIAKSFGFDSQEMASFYKTDNQWNQGEEIPLLSVTDENETMANCFVNQTLVKEDDKLIYIYDFLSMWTFYVELIEICNNLQSEQKILLSVGELPNEAPSKEFKAEKTAEFFEEDEDDNLFDSYDELYNEF